MNTLTPARIAHIQSLLDEVETAAADAHEIVAADVHFGLAAIRDFLAGLAGDIDDDEDPVYGVVF